MCFLVLETHIRPCFNPTILILATLPTFQTQEHIIISYIKATHATQLGAEEERDIIIIVVINNVINYKLEAQ